MVAKKANFLIFCNFQALFYVIQQVLKGISPQNPLIYYIYMKTNRKSKTNKSIIDTYETIYNVDLVVANRYTTIDQLNKTYCNVNQEDLTDCESIAYTEIGYNRKTNKPVVIVRYVKNCEWPVDKKLDLINTAAHEALHVCMDIYTKIGEKVYEQDSNELFAYLVGWVTECIYKTWTKKTK